MSPSCHNTVNHPQAVCLLDVPEVPEFAVCISLSCLYHSLQRFVIGGSALLTQDILSSAVLEVFEDVTGRSKFHEVLHFARQNEPSATCFNSIKATEESLLTLAVFA